MQRGSMPLDAEASPRRAGVGALKEVGALTDIHAKARRKRSRRWLRLLGVRRSLMALAALPVFQATGCFPDPLGAINFELQRLLSGTFINAFNIIVRNILDL